MGRMPSAVGYQPTLAQEVGALQGADYLHAERRHYFGTGGLCSGGRSDGPGAGNHLCPLGRNHGPLS